MAAKQLSLSPVGPRDGNLRRLQPSEMQFNNFPQRYKTASKYCLLELEEAPEEVFWAVLPECEQKLGQGARTH